MIITVFIINESVQIVYYNVTKAKENKSSGSQTTPPPQNFGRWNVFIAVQKKNRCCAVFLKKKISNLPPNLSCQACW